MSGCLALQIRMLHKFGGPPRICAMDGDALAYDVASLPVRWGSAGTFDLSLDTGRLRGVKDWKAHPEDLDILRRVTKWAPRPLPPFPASRP